MEYKYKLDYAEIAKRIKGIRKVAGLTQAELVEKINISTNAIAKLETNLMTVSLQTAINISNVLDLDINYLLVNKDAEKQEQTVIDTFFDSLTQKLTQKDKEFLIHIINGLKTYRE